MRDFECTACVEKIYPDPLFDIDMKSFGKDCDHRAHVDDFNNEQLIDLLTIYRYFKVKQAVGFNKLSNFSEYVRSQNGGSEFEWWKYSLFRFLNDFSFFDTMYKFDWSMNSWRKFIGDEIFVKKNFLTQRDRDFSTMASMKIVKTPRILIDFCEQCTIAARIHHDCISQSWRWHNPNKLKCSEVPLEKKEILCSHDRRVSPYFEIEKAITEYGIKYQRVYKRETIQRQMMNISEYKVQLPCILDTFCKKCLKFGENYPGFYPNHGHWMNDGCFKCPHGCFADENLITAFDDWCADHLYLRKEIEFFKTQYQAWI